MAKPSHRLTKQDHLKAMPIRRRGDGEIVEEPTNPQTQRQAGRSEAPTSEAPKEPASALGRLVYSAGAWGEPGQNLLVPIPA